MDIFVGEMFRLRFDHLDIRSDLWILPHDSKFKLNTKKAKKSNFD